MTASPKARDYRIPADLRPVVEDRIRELNGQGHSDRQIGHLLGYSQETIRNLRNRAGIAAIPAGSHSIGRGPVERECPACTVPVDVHAGVVTDHKAFLGRTANGIQLADPCPASGRQYAALTQHDYLSATVPDKRS